MRRALGLAVSLCVAAAAVAACRPSGDSGYVEIKTVPVTPVTKTALYLDATKLAPIKEGSTVLRQPVGTLKLQTDGKGGAMAALCDIEIKKDRPVRLAAISDELIKRLNEFEVQPASETLVYGRRVVESVRQNHDPLLKSRLNHLPYQLSTAGRKEQQFSFAADGICKWCVQ